MKRLPLLAGLAAALALGMLVGGWLASREKAPQGATKRGEHLVFSQTAENLRSLHWRHDEGSVVALRLRPGEVFDVLQRTDASPQARHCRVKADLNGLLPQLSEWVALRSLSESELKSEFPHDAGLLEMRDQMRLEALPILELWLSADRTRLAARMDGLIFELKQPIGAVLDLQSLCKGAAVQ